LLRFGTSGQRQVIVNMDKGLGNRAESSRFMMVSILIPA